MATAKKKPELLLVLIVVLFLAIIVGYVSGQDQSGFISIDCGSSESYTDQTTGIDYVPDRNFIDSGESANVAATYNVANLKRPLKTLMSFPVGVRNCYTLRRQVNTVNGTRFLIRAQFMYGNYDSQNRLPEFDLYIGVNLWATIKFQSISSVTTVEMIYVTTTNVTSVCLTYKGLGTPFISALELRDLPDNAYVIQIPGSLNLVRRANLIQDSTTEFRFEDDAYDRIWEPVEWTQGQRYISSNSNETIITSNSFNTPEAVMRTAVSSSNASNDLDFFVKPDKSTDQYFFYFHIAELQNLTALNQTRVFNIYLNNNLFYGPITPSYLTLISVLTTSPQSAQRFDFSMRRTANSTLPPILNAYEIYKINPLSQSQTDATDVGAVNTIKSTYGINKVWQGDPCAPQNYSWEGLNCSFNGFDPPSITALNLSSSNLTGPISSVISNLKSLERLDLSKNNLSGTIPEFLSTMTSLKYVNLGGNNFTGTVPVSLFKRSTEGSLTLSVEGNPNLCISEPCNKRGRKSNVIVPVVASIAGLIGFLLIVFGIFYIYRKRKVTGGKETEVAALPFHNGGPTRDTLKPNKQRFTYSEVLSITNNFQKVIGTGGFGTVYHGYLDDTQVAVKILAPSSSQGYKEFQAEAQLLTRVHHRNLTSLIGYCDEDAKLGLIYEYMANGNLEAQISEKSSEYLIWEDRLQIAIDAAQGLDYLHNGCKPPIVHLDVKTTNILLNERFQAKLADFGLSRVYPTDGGTEDLYTVVAGSPGYLDPEYYRTQRLNEKSDVYSFGVVLLQIITSQPIATKKQERTHISEWVNQILLTTGAIKSIVDFRLEGDYDNGSAWKAIELAMSCVSSPSNRRPTMSDVVNELKQCLNMERARKTEGYKNETVESNDLVFFDLESEQPLPR